MKQRFIQLFMAALLACAGTSAQAAITLQDTVATASSDDASSGQAHTTSADVLAGTVDTDGTSVTSDLHAETHLDINVGNAATAAPRHPTIPGDGTVVTNSTPGGSPVNLPHVPEPSSQTAVYFLSGVIGLGIVVMRRRRRALG